MPINAEPSDTPDRAGIHGGVEQILHVVGNVYGRLSGDSGVKSGIQFPQNTVEINPRRPEVAKTATGDFHLRG